MTENPHAPQGQPRSGERGADVSGPEAQGLPHSVSQMDRRTTCQNHNVSLSIQNPDCHPKAIAKFWPRNLHCEKSLEGHPSS